MKLRRGKGKAMAPQVETVELPDIIDPVQETNGGWMVPRNWSDEDIRDWLATHPEVRPQAGTITNVDSHDLSRQEFDEDEAAEAADAPNYEAEDAEHDRMNAIADEQEVAALKADGMHAIAIAIPPHLKDQVTVENYDPREFFLVHTEVWNEMVQATYAEAELGLENKELRKRVNALTRGMRKVNKHWSATKNQLKRLTRTHEDYCTAAYNVQLARESTHEEELKRERILTTRVARRLRKARAGRDKRERQLLQSQQEIQALGSIVNKQDDYIGHLERLLNGNFPK